MDNHKYTLQPYKGSSSRHTCPRCNKIKQFSKYIETENGEVLADHVGRCERVDSCGYHYTPKQYFIDNGIGTDNTPWIGHPKEKMVLIGTPNAKPISYIEVDAFKASLSLYSENHFVKYLTDLFTPNITQQVIERYFIGTSKYWPGATIFWQIDVSGKIRTGKIMLYNPATGKRVKEPRQHIHWVHKIISPEDFNLKQSLFGEHLINSDPEKPIAIVESEKTAIIASVYLPEFVWVAAGSLTNLSLERCEGLKGRTIVLFPDVNGYERWKEKATQLSSIGRVSVSDLLERKATDDERQRGLDLADYLITFDYKDFTGESPVQYPTIVEEPEAEAYAKALAYDFDETTQVIEPPVIKSKPAQQPVRIVRDFKISWNNEIAELQAFFDKAILPPVPYRLNSYSVCHDLKKYIDTNLSSAKANNGNKTFLPHLERLHELRLLISNN